MNNNYYFETYQYIIKMNDVVVMRSQAFDAPWPAVNDFFKFAKKHYPDETFKRIALTDGGVCFVNEQPTHKRYGVTTTIRLEIRFYLMQAEPMTCTSFVDNMLNIEKRKLQAKTNDPDADRDEGHLGDILDTASWNNFN